MIIDTRGIDSGTTLRAEVCVAGAGPAGISIALERSRSSRSLNAGIWFTSLFPGENTIEEAPIQLRRKLQKRDRVGESALGPMVKVASHPLDTAKFLLCRTFQSVGQARRCLVCLE